MLGPRLLSQHNLWFYASLVREARRAIREQRYAAWAARTLADMRDGDEVVTGRPDTPPQVAR